jgi:hypothetical protein
VVLTSSKNDASAVDAGTGCPTLTVQHRTTAAAAIRYWEMPQQNITLPHVQLTQGMLAVVAGPAWLQHCAGCTPPSRVGHLHHVRPPRQLQQLPLIVNGIILIQQLLL